MKNLIEKIWISAAIASLCFILGSCSKNSDDDSSGGGTNNPPSGQWRVAVYWDNTDETHHFAGYNFTFNAGGSVTASNGSNTVSGTWSQTSTKFILNFGTTAPFDELTDDWQIVEKTATSIKLKDDNTAQDDRLEFVRL